MAQANADINGLKARFSQMQEKQTGQNPNSASQNPVNPQMQTTPQANSQVQASIQNSTPQTTNPAQVNPQVNQEKKVPAQAVVQNTPVVADGTKSPLDALQGAQDGPVGEDAKPPINVVEVEGEANSVVGETVVHANVVHGETAIANEGNSTANTASAIQTQGEPVTDETIIEESLEDLREEYDDAKLNSIIIEQVKELIEIDNNLNNKLEDIRIDLKKEVEEREKLNKKIDDNYAELKELEKSIDKFIALYELVTNQFNPFVKQNEGQTQQKMQDLMKDVKSSEQNIQNIHAQQALTPQNPSPASVSQSATSSQSQVNPQQLTHVHFETKNGLRVNTLPQLIDAIQNMSDGEFVHHVSDSKNDFATWIADALRNPALAQSIQSIKVKQDIIAVLQGTLARAASAQQNPANPPVNQQ